MMAQTKNNNVKIHLINDFEEFVLHKLDNYLI